MILSIRRKCSGREFQVDDVETENARDEQLLVMPYGLSRRFMLEEHDGWKVVDD